MNSQFLNKKTKRDKDNLQTRMKENLVGSKFRILNEKLYTISSDEAYKYFQENPEDFSIYHQGFLSQATKWPINPNQVILDELRKDVYTNKTIADLGCGEAFIAQQLKNRTIHSFDLVKYNQFITECDIKNVPLKDGECDIAVFCLSLMGTNFFDFIKEANRILNSKGILIVAEIMSRIVSVKKFLEVFNKLGFKLRKKKNIKDYFSIFVFRKEDSGNKMTTSNITETSHDILKPCIYKKR